MSLYLLKVNNLFIANCKSKCTSPKMKWKKCYMHMQERETMDGRRNGLFWGWPIKQYMAAKKGLFCIPPCKKRSTQNDIMIAVSLYSIITLLHYLCYPWRFWQRGDDLNGDVSCIFMYSTYTSVPYKPKWTLYNCTYVYLCKSTEQL